MRLRLQAIGNATGLLLPKQVLKHLRVKNDGSLLAIEVHGAYFLTRYDREVEEQSKLGLDFMKQYTKTFRTLAK
jgi:antitoxin component of MazEF toxin-antitoxin module